MVVLRSLFFALVASLSWVGTSHALTWNEPWHREVVSQSSAFGLYQVERAGKQALTLKRIRQIAGEDTGPMVELASFYALQVSSSTGNQAPEFTLREGTQAYFYLKRVAGGWAIATPSAGFAAFHKNGKVLATYRFSAHQAVVDAQLYETSQRCIFQALHGDRTCDPEVVAWIDATLAKPAASIESDSTLESLDGFFQQHAALETAGFLGHPLSTETVERFLSKPGMHVQMSALRALLVSDHRDKAERLMTFVEDDKANATARCLAAMLLVETGAHQMKQRLLDYAPRASDDEAGLGIAIMDQRIGTQFPYTVRSAVKIAAQQL